MLRSGFDSPLHEIVAGDDEASVVMERIKIMNVKQVFIGSPF